MKQKATLSIGGVLLVIVAAIFYPKPEEHAASGEQAPPAVASPTEVGAAAAAARPPTKPPAAPRATAPTASQSPPATALPASTSKIGFTSRAGWQSHFEKHGAEFGELTAEEYLAKAKSLRDAPLSRDVLELKRDDGVITRFDRKSGAFVAFHDDKTIRTFFRPDDGEAYFKRQAGR